MNCSLQQPNVKEAEVLLQAGADALVIGDDRFGMRLPGAFSVEETAEVVAIAYQTSGACVCIHD